MADADDDAGGREPRNLGGGHRLGGDCRQQMRQLPPCGDQGIEVGLVHRPDQRRVVRTLPGETQMRTLEMETEETGHPAARRLDAGGDDSRCLFRRVGNEGWQAPRRAVADVGRADRFDGRNVGRKVELRPAAAIHLEVDQPRGDRAAIEGHALDVERRIGCRDPFDAVTGDDQHRAVPPQLAVEDARTGISEAVGHRVSVTLLRCGGWSGSKPRLRDSSSTKP